MADVSAALRSWSTNAASNNPTGSTPIGTGLDDNLRQLQATVRQYLASKGSSMSSAATVTLANADGYLVDITGTTTTSSFGTEVAGVSYWLRYFPGGATTWTITYSAGAMILPGSADIVMAAGDVIRMTSLGSGNWLCTSYTPRSGLVTLTGTQTLTNKTLTSPTINTPTITTPTITGVLTGVSATLSAGITAAGAISGTNITGSGAINGATVAGAMVASAAQSLTGTATNLLMTPGGFAGNKTLAADGFYKLPGGLTLKWGTFTAATTAGTVVTFSAGSGAAFSSACYHVSVAGHDGVTGAQDNGPNVVQSSLTASGFSYANSRGSIACTFFAIGV